MKQTVILNIKNNTIGTVPLTILGPLNNNNIINARTRYAWDLTGVSFGTGAFSIEAKGNASQPTFQLYSGVASDPSSLATALNNLNIGVFWIETSGPNVSLVTWNDTDVYRNLILNAAGTLAVSFVSSLLVPGSISLTLTGSGTITGYVDWGDGNQSNFSGSGTISPGHSYTSAGAHTVSVYVASSLANITGLTISHCRASSITNFSALTNLASIDFSNNILTTLDITGNPAIINCIATFDALTVTTVNNILVALDNAGLLNGNVDISAQTPPATPTGAGIVAANNLSFKGWIVATD